MIHRPHPVPADPGLRIGCAGWSIASKVAQCFPTEGSHLQRYAQVFACVEINSSFHRSHQPQTYARWADAVPDAFRFSVKMPRAITHELRLQQCEAPLRAFLHEAGALGSKLGCILVQLPPSLAFQAREASGFFSLLRKHTSVAVACEMRHASWLTLPAARVMRAAGIACVQAHPSPVGDFAHPCDAGTYYIRLHGAPRIYFSAYDDVFIDAVAGHIRAARAQRRQVWCIFDNTVRGEAVPNALTLMQQLSREVAGAEHDAGKAPA